MLDVIRKVYPNARGTVIASVPDERAAQKLIDRQIKADQKLLRGLFGDLVGEPVKYAYPSIGTGVFGCEVVARLDGQVAGAVAVWANLQD